MFTINGVDYPSWDHVPEELRRQLSTLPDADRNGIPDLIEGTSTPAADTFVRTQTFVESSTRSYVIDSPADFAALPPELRELLAGGRLGAEPQDAPSAPAPPTRPQDAGPQDVGPQDAPVVRPSVGPQDSAVGKPSWLRRVLGG